MKKQMMMLVLVVLLSVANVASATVMTFYVDDDATGYNNGSSWSDAFTELQSALDVAIAGDQIWVAEGTYYPTSDYGLAIGDRGRHFRMINGVEIYGGFAGSETTLAQRNVQNNETILSGDLLGNDNPATSVQNLLNDPNRADNCYHVFYHPDGTNLDETAILDGVTITEANADGSSSYRSGAGMYNDNASSPTVTNCTFSNNSANHEGGGMNNEYGSNPTITNCTFSNNSAGNEGGGMSNDHDSSPTITNCTFSNNSADKQGGGMYNDNASSPTVTNCTFIGNTSAGDGGGMHNDDYSNPTVTNCTFSGNSINKDGGGMHNEDYSNPTVTNCTFSNNSASDVGGGMYDEDGSSPTVTNCTFSGNSAKDGGGMHNEDDSSPTVTNCTFSGNNSARHGGGMSNRDGGSPTVTNCTFSGNTANNRGGGMNNNQYSSPIVTNCILWGNTASNNNEIRGTVSVSYSCVQDGYTGSGNIDTDPQFVDPNGLDGIIGTEDDNLRLLSWSQCIDAGDPNYVLDPNYPTDLDGNPRIVNGIVDMGAYELQNTAPDANAGDDQTVPTGPDGEAQVVLDCSASDDPDGDGLSYSWYLDGEEIATGYNPTIVLPCGDYTIELIVNDGTEDSEPDYVDISVPDGTAPEITCPEDVTIECDQSFAPSNTGYATAVDNCSSDVSIIFNDHITLGDCVNGIMNIITRTWTATDGEGNSSSCDQIITSVDTTAPVISDLDADHLLAAVGQAVTFSVSASDNCDSNVDLQWDFGDTTSASGANPVHSYSSGGIYTVSVTATDSCGNTSTDDIIVVVYDPSAGFTTGGGWFVPDSESRIGGELVTDTVSKANFGFVVKYKKGADDPDGKLEFQYKAGDIDLKSTDMEWLVVQSASKVSFKGKAIINGEDLHTFKVTADDNGEPGAGVDKFKIEIWLGVEEDVENTNQTPKHTAKGVLGGGNIQIHQK